MGKIFPESNKAKFGLLWWSGEFLTQGLEHVTIFIREPYSEIMNKGMTFLTLRKMETPL